MKEDENTEKIFKKVLENKLERLIEKFENGIDEEFGKKFRDKFNINTKIKMTFILKDEPEGEVLELNKVI